MTKTLRPGKVQIAARRAIRLCALVVLLCVAPGLRAAVILPANFSQAAVGSGWVEPVGICWDTTNRMYVWERRGKVWLVENGVKQSTPLIDIAAEVGGWRDYGFLGFALDPNFSSNLRVYCLYVVDRHHLTKFGTGAYSSTTDEYFAATIGRITRYTLTNLNGQLSCNYNSRTVLVGESITNGVPILHQSHGVGTLLFGTDGTLLASVGDGASYEDANGDLGSDPDTYYQQGLTDKIIRQNENVGSFRAQMVDSLSGKILRIDPDTGNGVSSNPWYDATKPRAAKSRVWAMGFRNPCRMSLRPGTGSHNPADADPGVLMIGEVGWRTWEELNVCTGPGQNFGWPLFEGMDPLSQYSSTSVNIENRDTTNTNNTCGRPYFYFRELLVQDTLGTPSWPNPCNSGIQIPAAAPRHEHRRPSLIWRHPQGGGQNSIETRVPTYSGNTATSIGIGESGSPVSGVKFKGDASIGGAWYNGASYPPQYAGSYFHTDYTGGWLRQVSVNSSQNLTSVQPFLEGSGPFVFVTSHPTQGDLYYINWDTSIFRISYNTNLPPTVVMQSDKQYGPGPLTVKFSGTNSFDPEGGALTYLWNFGDGTTSTQASPQKTFAPPNGNPISYTTTLRVTDPAGRTNTATLAISVNNTPPVVNITSPTNQSRYSLSAVTLYPCTAQVSDGEHSTNALSYSWVTKLYHNTHNHSDPPVTNVTTVTQIDPIGCNGEIYFYGISLTVTDPLGLSASKEVFVYPDCDQLPPSITWPTPASINQGVALSSNQLNATATIDGSFAYNPSLGTVLPAGSNQVLTASFTPVDLGQWSIITATQRVTVIGTNPPVPPAPPIVTIVSPTNSVQFANGANIPVSVSVASNSWAIASVELRENEVVLNSKSAPPYSFLLSNSIGGSRSLHARAYYDGTNYAASPSVVIGVAWKPVQLTFLALTNTTIHLGLDADSNRIGQIEASTNLLNWAVVVNFTNHTGLIQFTEPAATNDHRFYRGRFNP
jgi:glucose/arabinose dehydrogenase